MKCRSNGYVSAILAGSALFLPGAAMAQSIPYAPVAQASEGSGDGSESSGSEEFSVGGLGQRGKRVNVAPYIEAQQFVQGELAPGDEVLTYTTVAAGIDADVAGRNSRGSVSLRYERRFGHGSNRLPDTDAVSGVARASVAVASRAVTLEAGAMATRVNVANNGATLGGVPGNASSQIYGAYVGPSLRTRVGELEVEGHYRFGYNRVEAPDVPALGANPGAADIYDDGTVHHAQLRAGFREGTVLPVGVGVGAGWRREDSSNLDQRIDDKNLRADVTLPLNSEVSLVGGVGYEDVSVSHRDAIRDPVTGEPVRGSDGRMVADESRGRQLAYDAEGLIWDAGLLWRPSKRTGFEAHIGRRYGSTSYFGSFAYAPNSRVGVNVSVYDNVMGFGGMLNNQLAALPTQFEGLRNPLSGDLGGCVAAGGSSAGQGNCFGGALASVNSASFRGRGVMGSIGVRGRNLQYGIGIGYDRRKFLAAPGSILEAANGVTDESLWMSAYLNGRIDRNSSFGTNLRASWHQGGDPRAGAVSSVGATAAYYRTLISRLTATAAIGVEGVNREVLEELWTAQAMVGVRYTF